MLKQRIMRAKANGGPALRQVRAGEGAVQIQGTRFKQCYILPDSPGDGAAPMRHFVVAQPVNRFTPGDERSNDAHHQVVFNTRHYKVADFKGKIRVATLMKANRMAVEPYLGTVVDRAKTKAQATPLRGALVDKRPVKPGHAFKILHAGFQAAGNGYLPHVRTV